MTDTTILLLLALKNNWSLIGAGLTGSDITYSTGWYSSEVVVPQITVTQVSDDNMIMETGLTPVYGISDMYAIDIWVRPETTSGASFGKAKNSIYNMRKEVKRIIRNAGNIGSDTQQEFVVFSSWRNLNEVAPRPVIFRTRINVLTYKYRSVNDE